MAQCTAWGYEAWVFGARAAWGVERVWQEARALRPLQDRDDSTRLEARERPKQ